MKSQSDRLCPAPSSTDDFVWLRPQRKSMRGCAEHAETRELTVVAQRPIDGVVREPGTRPYPTVWISACSRVSKLSVNVLVCAWLSYLHSYPTCAGGRPKVAMYTMLTVGTLKIAQSQDHAYRCWGASASRAEGDTFVIATNPSSPLSSTPFLES